MTDELLEQLKAMDQAVLTHVVRQDQGDSELLLLDWTVKPLNHEKIIDTTGGLFCFSGQSQSTLGIRPWKVVMKCINNPKEPSEDPRVWYYWRREILAFQSGFLAQLPPGVRAPRFYEVLENENGAWIWMENIQETTGKRWSLEHFQRAARHLGRSQGHYLEGTPLVDQPWLSQAFFRNIWDKEGWWSKFMNPASSQNAWQSPITQRGFGKSTGKPDFVGPKTIAALEAGFQKFSKEPFVDATRLGVFGYSRGAIAYCRGAAGNVSHP